MSKKKKLELNQTVLVYSAEHDLLPGEKVQDDTPLSTVVTRGTVVGIMGDCLEVQTRGGIIAAHARQCVLAPEKDYTV